MDAYYLPLDDKENTANFVNEAVQYCCMVNPYIFLGDLMLIWINHKMLMHAAKISSQVVGSVGS